MVKRKEEFTRKDKHDAGFTDNSFTQAVKKASNGGASEEENAKSAEKENDAAIQLKARDELMRAKEARNETTTESEKFRRDEA